MYIDSLLVIDSNYTFDPDGTKKPAPGFGLELQYKLTDLNLPSKTEAGKSLSVTGGFL